MSDVLIANIVGIAAVAMFVLSYQCKTRIWIISLNAGSRVLYVLQYLLLGGLDGAVLDLVALVVSLAAQRKDREPFVRIPKTLIIGSNLLIVGIGLTFYQNIFSLLPIFGVLFETGALWLNKERSIRFVSFFGAPFWLAYNLTIRGYGSAIGNVMTMVSIGLAILRYDILKKEEKKG